jgi:hypothetical protein
MGTTTSTGERRNGAHRAGVFLAGATVCCGKPLPPQRRHTVFDMVRSPLQKQKGNDTSPRMEKQRSPFGLKARSARPWTGRRPPPRRWVSHTLQDLRPRDAGRAHKCAPPGLIQRAGRAVDFASPREEMKTLDGDEPSRLARPTSGPTCHVHIGRRRADQSRRQPARTGVFARANGDSSLARHGHPRVVDGSAGHDCERQGPRAPWASTTADDGFR